MKSGNYLLPGNSLLGNHSEMNSVHSYGIAALMRSGFDLTIFGSERVCLQSSQLVRMTIK